MKPTLNKSAAMNHYIEEHTKSVFAAVLLSMLFGPVGAAYGSLVGGFILTGATVFLVSTAQVLLVDTGIGMYQMQALPTIGSAGVLFFAWIIGIISGVMGVLGHNDRVRATAAMFGEK